MLLDGRPFSWYELHNWSNEGLDAFVELVRTADEEGAWIHVHCHAGKGRTAALLVAMDMTCKSGRAGSIATLRSIAVGQKVAGPRAPVGQIAPPTPKSP